MSTGISYELAKELKEAGFPQHQSHHNGDPCYVGLTTPENEARACVPTLDELIEACPKPLQITIMPNGFTQACWLGGDGLCCHYHTPKEAVANLWLTINKK